MKVFYQFRINKYPSKSKKMKDFLNKLKIYEKMFMYNYSFYDRAEFKLKIYYFSPDQEHQYLSIEINKNSDNMHKCEIGALYITEDSLFEDTPTHLCYIPAKGKTEFDKFYNTKKIWSNRKIKFIKESFSPKNLII